MKNKQGFTLIELIVVIGIIAVLTSIVLFMMTAPKQKGSDTAKVQAVQQIQKALQLYVTDYGYYPTGTNLSILVPKYIGSIDPTIKYQSTNMNNTVCASNCPSYHLGIVLARSDNSALSFDKDITTGSLVGSSTDCATAATIPDLCYDITP